MKKVFLVFIVFLCFSAKGQKFYVGLGFGYIETGLADQPYLHDGGGYNTTNVVQGSIGYLFTHKLSVELAINQLSCNNSDNFYPYYFLKVSLRLIRFMPMLKYNFYYKGLTFYLKAGASIGLDNKLEWDINYTNDFPPYIHILNSEYNGGISPGYSLGIGGEYKIYKSLSFYGEINYIYNYWSRTHLTIFESVGDPVIERTPLNIHAQGFNIGLKYGFK